MTHRLSPKPKPRRNPDNLTGKEQFEKLDDSDSQPMKELMWEFGPSLVAQAEAMVGHDPDAIKSLLEANRRFLEEKLLNEMAGENVGEKIKENMRKHLRPR